MLFVIFVASCVSFYLLVSLIRSKSTFWALYVLIALLIIMAAVLVVSSTQWM